MYVDGRRVYVVTGAKSQSIKICTQDNVRGSYEYAFRLPADRAIATSAVDPHMSLSEFRDFLVARGASEEHRPHGIARDKGPHVRVANVGIVREATVRMSDLSIVMGPNNSGKSTTAVILYAVAKASIGFQPRRRLNRDGADLFSRPGIGGRAASRSLITTSVKRLQTQLAENATEEERNAAFRAHIPGLATEIIKDFGLQFVAELEAGTGASLSLLARHSATGRRLPLKIQITSTAPKWSIEIRLRGPSWKSSVEVDSSIDHDVGDIAHILDRVRGFESYELRAGLAALADTVASVLFAQFPRSSHYLPAARAGLLQSHRLVAAAMFQRTSQFGLGEVSVPSLSGVVADFVSEILLTEDRRRGPFAKLADRLQRDILRGEVRQGSGDGAGYPEIVFLDASGTYPIQRTSSMVSELAPIVLLLRSAISSNDLLIIEEPESHLHPDTQTRLARYLFEAASSGLRIVVTTHSDYFVSQISNLIRSVELDSRRRSPDVAAYRMDSSEDGSRLIYLPIDAYEGISDQPFTDVAIELYNQQTSQQLALSDRDGRVGE